MKRLSFILILLISNTSYGAQWQQSPELDKLFEEAAVKATFVVYDVQEDKFIGYNSARAEKRYIPASSFKIANTLIGLNERAVKNVDEILPYGGGPQYLKSWEHDMSLRQAIKISNVPIYQELARRIGLKAMQKNIEKLNFGNKEIGNIVDKFWLQGPLKISAIEQVKFLSALALNQLDYPKNIQQQVRDITVLEQNDKWVLHGKTGLTDTPDPDIGWWIGWVNRGGKIYCFALNIDFVKAGDAKLRIELGKASLKILSIL